MADVSPFEALQCILRLAGLMPDASTLLSTDAACLPERRRHVLDGHALGARMIYSIVDWSTFGVHAG